MSEHNPHQVLDTIDQVRLALLAIRSLSRPHIDEDEGGEFGALAALLATHVDRAYGQLSEWLDAQGFGEEARHE